MIDIRYLYRYTLQFAILDSIIIALSTWNDWTTTLSLSTLLIGLCIIMISIINLFYSHKFDELSIDFQHTFTSSASTLLILANTHGLLHLDLFAITLGILFTATIIASSRPSQNPCLLLFLNNFVFGFAIGSIVAKIWLFTSFCFLLICLNFAFFFSSLIVFDITSLYSISQSFVDCWLFNIGLVIMYTIVFNLGKFPEFYSNLQLVVLVFFTTGFSIYKINFNLRDNTESLGESRSPYYQTFNNDFYNQV